MADLRVWILPLFVLGIASYVGAVPVGSCQQHGAYLSDDNNCATYYSCNWDNPVLFNCPAGLQFNMAAKVCDWPQNVNCVLGGVGSDGNSEDAKSDEDDQIDIGNGNNNGNSNGNGNGNILSSDGCDPNNCKVDANGALIINMPNLKDCTKFCRCDWGGGGAGQVGDDPSAGGGGGDGGSGSGGGGGGGAAGGSGGPGGGITVVEMSCPAGTHFSPSLLVCDWPQSAKCVV